MKINISDSRKVGNNRVEITFEYDGTGLELRNDTNTDYLLSEIQLEEGEYSSEYADLSELEEAINNPDNYDWYRFKGEDGKDGKDGVAGKDGVGIEDTTLSYALSDNGTTPPEGGWAAQVPPLTKGQYLWTKTVWEYTDDTSETSYNVSYIPKDGNTGKDGLPGKDGVGIENTIIHYAGSNDGNNPPTRGWQTQVPDVPQGEYLWTRTTWEYTDDTSETGYSVAHIGEDGVDGLDGEDGQDGIVTVLLEPEGNTIRNHEGTLSLEFIGYVGSKPLVFDEIKWYKLNPQHQGDSVGGKGWEPLSGSDKTLVVSPSMIDSVGVFKAMGQYNDEWFTQTTTLLDITDPYTVTLIGTNVFKNGKGEIYQSAKVYQNGVEVDKEGNYQYEWRAYDYSGNLIRSFNKSGKDITISADEVDHMSNIVVEVKDV